MCMFYTFSKTKTFMGARPQLCILLCTHNVQRFISTIKKIISLPLPYTTIQFVCACFIHFLKRRRSWARGLHQVSRTRKCTWVHGLKLCILKMKIYVGTWPKIMHSYVHDPVHGQSMHCSIKSRINIVYLIKIRICTIFVYHCTPQLEHQFTCAA